MVTVRFSKNKELILPRSLGETLGLREGDRVQVQRQDDVLQLQRRVTTSGRDTTPLAFENSHSDGTPLAFENSHSDGTVTGSGARGVFTSWKFTPCSSYARNSRYT